MNMHPFEQRLRRAWFPVRPAWVLGVALGFGVMAQNPEGTRVLPPLPPSPRAPVELFRELLAASPGKRAVLLESKTPSARELILRRIQQHEALDPVARAEAEWQLRLAQFRFYLSPLLRAPAADRERRLSQAPAEDRPLLEERLRAWDALTPSARSTLLESEESLHHFVRSPGAEPSRLTNLLASAPATARADIERQFARWSALPESERVARAATFQEFFGLSDVQKSRALNRLPDTDRIAMEKVLERFARLPESERAQCVAGFERLSALPASEREEFLRNAARWQAMTSEERALWRRLVLKTRLPPLPPLPTSGLVTTNR